MPEVRRLLKKVLFEGIDPERLPGATSVRGCLGLILERIDLTNPSFSDDQMYDYIDPENRPIIPKLYGEYQAEITRWMDKNKNRKRRE